MATLMINPESSITQSIRRLRQFFHHTMKNPQWTIMDLLSRSAYIRQTLKSFRRSVPNNTFDITKSLFKPLDTTKFTRDLERDGVACHLKLPHATLNDLVTHAQKEACYGNSKTEYGFRYNDKTEAEKKVGRKFSRAEFFELDQIPALARLTHDPLLHEIAAKYFQSMPVYTGSRLWWTFAAKEQDFDSTGTSSFFHFDKDDYACLRFFFYLTDVDDHSGPHIVVRKSHNRKRLNQLFSLNERKDQEIVDTYGKSNITTVYGKAGTGFAEDPFCFHKGSRPTNKNRLILQIKFATKNYGVFSQPDMSTCRNILN